MSHVRITLNVTDEEAQMISDMADFREESIQTVIRQAIQTEYLCHKECDKKRGRLLLRQKNGMIRFLDRPNRLQGA